MSTNGMAPPRRHAAGPAIALGLSGLDERARALATTAAASLSIAKLEPKHAFTATHVVAPTVRRSLKILHAAARGAWVRATRDDRTRDPDHTRPSFRQKLGSSAVVSRPTWRDPVPARAAQILSPAWLDDSAAVGHTLPPCDYELSSARAARLRRPPGGALAGLEVTLCSGLPLATCELRSLLRAAGADVAPTVRAESEGVRCTRAGDNLAGVGYGELLDGILAGGLIVPPCGAALSTRPEGDATAGPVADVPAGHRLQFVTSAPARNAPRKSPRGAPGDRRAKRRRAAASADAAAEPTEAEAFYARDAALSLYRDRLPDCNVDCAAGPRGWHDFLGGLSEQGVRPFES